jgi:hypothetical protein
MTRSAFLHGATQLLLGAVVVDLLLAGLILLALFLTREP